MTTVNTYLYFNGDCESAFNFYKAVFKKEFQYLGRYKDVPEAARINFPNCTDEQIMHVALPISKETVLLGADIIEPNKKETKNNFSLFLSTDNREEADRLFRALSKGGKITLPLSDQFWGSYYGICLDRFGINWKISCS
ncbi:VOC family protein [uncultured Arcticibacterium sp.]|uniref:VOC family protein n=1 Tax=uncultured Arcticibacterium sp. TaxID=2173042 RepID=UPI0030F6E984